MKKLLLGLFLLPIFCNAQTELDKDNGVTVNMSVGAGHVNETVKPMGKFSVGGMYEGNHLAVNIELFATRLKAFPAIPSLTYGVASRSWEAYGGIAYHLYTLDYGYFKKNEYYPIFGLLHKFPKTALTIDASFTSNIYSLKLGIGCIR